MAKVNYLSLAKDVGEAVFKNVTPAISYMLAPSLGPLAGVASSLLTAGLNYGLSWGLTSYQKYGDRKGKNAELKALKKSIAQGVAKSSPHEKRKHIKNVQNNLKSWLKVID